MERTHCPACGAALPERSREMSNCLYCGFPFEFAEQQNGAETAESPFRARIERVKEHQDYPAALEWDPPLGLDYLRARDRRKRGVGFLAGGLVIGLIPVLAGKGIELLSTTTVLGALLFGLGAWNAVRGFLNEREQLRWPIQRRPCAIADRRSVTTPLGLAGRTDYHFTLEFDDGQRARFRWPGRGQAQEPLSTGVTGVAYTRGGTLLSFRQIRT